MMPHRRTRMRPSRPPGPPHNPITTLCTWSVLRWRASMGRVVRLPRRRDRCRRRRMRWGWGGRAGGRRRRAGMRAGASRWKRRRRPCGQGSCPQIGQQGPAPRSVRVGAILIMHECPLHPYILGPRVSSNARGLLQVPQPPSAGVKGDKKRKAVAKKGAGTPIRRRSRAGARQKATVASPRSENTVQAGQRYTDYHLLGTNYPLLERPFLRFDRGAGVILTL